MLWGIARRIIVGEDGWSNVGTFLMRIFRRNGAAPLVDFDSFDFSSPEIERCPSSEIIDLSRECDLSEYHQIAK